MQKLSRQVTVTNPQGLHARPADLLVRCAQQFQAEIKIEKAGNQVDAKSILEILMLAAEEGTSLVIHAQGKDAQPALNALAELFERGFHLEEQESGRANSHTAGENLP